MDELGMKISHSKVIIVYQCDMIPRFDRDSLHWHCVLPSKSLAQ
jgi:hypothetical protein